MLVLNLHAWRIVIKNNTNTAWDLKCLFLIVKILLYFLYCWIARLKLVDVETAPYVKTVTTNRSNTYLSKK